MILYSLYIESIVSGTAITSFGVPLCYDLIDISARFEFYCVSVDIQNFTVCIGAHPMKSNSLKKLKRIR